MGTSASFARKIYVCLVAALLSLALVPISAFAEDGHSGAERSEGAFGSEVPTSPQPPSGPSTEASGFSVTLSGAAEDGEVEGSADTKPLTLASGLAGAPSNFINSDVARDSEPVIGSFTVDGLTFAVTGESHVELVGVTPSVILSEGSEAAGAEGSDESHTSEAGVANLTLPESVAYADSEYTLASIAPYSFYLSGVTSVTLPASVSDVDDRAFRSSDVASVAVAEGNPTYASFDGALYSADKTRLLLIPEGRVGAVLLPREAEVADPGKFSHCSLVDAISVEDGAAFASENGLLYSSDLTTLLRVPAGATEITIREGCTTIAAGALEACAKLTTINAPATVTSISPDVFHAIPTVSLPAASVILGESGEAAGAEGPSEGQASEAGAQITAMIALSTTDDGLPEVDTFAITVALRDMATEAPWASVGFSIQKSPVVPFLEDSGEALSEGELASAPQPRAYPFIYACIAQAGGHFTYSQTRTVGTGFEATVNEKRAYFESAYNRSFVKVDGASFEISTQYGKGYAAGTAVPDPGFAFAGWNTDGSDKAAFTSQYFDGYASGGQFIVYAVFEPHPNTVSFDANYGSGGPSGSVIATYGEAMPTIPTTAPIRTGYEFEGWYDDRTGGKQYYTAAGASARNWDKAEDTTLYAHWKAISYPVSFDLGSFPTSDEAGSFNEDGWEEGRTFTVEDGKVAIPAPVRAGMRFLGWESSAPGLVSQEGTTWSIDCARLPGIAGAPTLTARWAYVVSVDTPAAVTFGEYDMATGDVTVGEQPNPSDLDDAYDVDSKKGAPVSFKSASKCDVGIEGITSASRAGISLIKAKEGASKDAEVRASDLVTMKVGEGAPTSRNSVSFALDDALGKDDLAPATAFVIPAEGSLPASFRLNLEENGAYVSDEAAGPEPESKDLAVLSYAYRAIPYGTGQLDSSGACTEDMYIPYDAANPFGLADIKEAANDIASRGYDSGYWWLYKHLMYEDERNKTNARVKVGAAYHDVQILGLRQDKLSTPTDGRTYAGLTFGWRDIYEIKQLHTSSDTSGGWAAASLSTYLQSTFFSALGSGLRDASTGIVEVEKRQQPYNSHVLQQTREKVFIPSMFEVYGLPFSNFNADEKGPDCFQYQSFALFEGQDGYNDLAIKQSNGVNTHWWVRSARVNGEGKFGTVHTDGTRSANWANATGGVVPCFAL